MISPQLSNARCFFFDLVYNKLLSSPCDISPSFLLESCGTHHLSDFVVVYIKNSSLTTEQGQHYKFSAASGSFS